LEGNKFKDKFGGKFKDKSKDNFEDDLQNDNSFKDSLHKNKDNYSLNFLKSLFSYCN